MISGKRVCVVFPAYNAAKTLSTTYSELPHEIIDDIILVDDCSTDSTAEEALNLGIHVVQHAKNTGYGGNQKTCYRTALERGADIVVMVHPDYQYAPELVTTLASAIASGLYDVALGSRILGTGALRGGMPLYKYIANRVLTFFQNLVCGYKLSEYHTGFRAFSREILETLPLEMNSDDFVFDNQMLVQAIYFRFAICEITCPTRYGSDASSISFFRSVKYGFGVLFVSVLFRLARWKMVSPLFLSRKEGLADGEEEQDHARGLVNDKTVGRL